MNTLKETYGNVGSDSCFRYIKLMSSAESEVFFILVILRPCSKKCVKIFPAVFTGMGLIIAKVLKVDR